MSVKTYSYQRDRGLWLSPHFTVGEFRCPSGVDVILNDTELIELLEKLYTRLHCSKIVITSGYRNGDSGYHGKGMAADINCYRPDGSTRYQGCDILLAAEDVGFRGIGWIPGSAASRAAVHVDTRVNKYWFDEANGNRSIGNSWYTFLGVTKPPSDKPDGAVIPASAAPAAFVAPAEPAEVDVPAEADVPDVPVAPVGPAGAPQSGDIDGDGLVTTTDARLALQAALGKLSLTDDQRAAADVDGDGEVSSTDARLILQRALNK